MNRVLNGVSRPFFGWVSDHLGREHTMFIAFALEGVAILLLASSAAIPLAFVLLTALVFFAYGEIYSLFPAICADVVRSQVRVGERGPALHRQGRRVAARAVEQRDRAHRRSGGTRVFIVVGRS